MPIAYLNQVVIPLEEGRLRGVFGPEYERYTAGFAVGCERAGAATGPRPSSHRSL